MRRVIHLVFMATALLGSALASPELDQALKQIVDNPEHPLSSLSVVAIKGGKVVYANAFGLRRIDPTDPSKNLPATLSTRYRIASISKLVTAVGVMRLVEDGKLDLDADISTYLGFKLRNPSFPDKPITVRSLLDHTSSIRDGEAYSIPTPYTLRDFFLPDGKFYQNGGHFDKEHAPGTYFQYTNLNFGVLGTLIERVSGLRFDLYMQIAVLNPLGISGGWNVTRFDPKAIDNLATLYRKREGEKWDPALPWQPQADDYTDGVPTAIQIENPDVKAGGKVAVDLNTYVLGSNATIFSPQGGLRVTGLELARVMLMLMNGGSYNGRQLLKPETIALMTSAQWTHDPAAKNGDNYYGIMRSWGLGVQRFMDISDKDGGDKLNANASLKWVGHLGEAYGLLSGFVFDPETKDGMIYIIGGVGSNPDDYLGKYSSFYAWEEEILTNLYDLAIK